jgi:RNA polymerase sigma-70 factor (ECF subfamily)
MDEADAIRRLRAGDIAGLEVLVHRYQVRAVRAAYLVVRERALAQDLVQSAFLRAFERIDGFDVTRPFGPWFLRLVLNDALKAVARRGREVHLGDAADRLAQSADPAPEPDRAWEHAETADQIWVALGLLTPVQRAAVVQRYYLDLTEAEMASVLGCPQSTVKSRLHAARERLRSLLHPARAPHDLETNP